MGNGWAGHRKLHPGAVCRMLGMVLLLLRQRLKHHHAAGVAGYLERVVRLFLGPIVLLRLGHLAVLRNIIEFLEAEVLMRLTFQLLVLD